MTRPDSIPLLHEYFRRQAAATPESPALDDGRRSVRYGELAERVQGVSAALRAGGVGAGAYVGLHLERSIDYVVATLAILDAGAAVVPLPPSYPESRTRQILGFAGLDAVVDGAETPVGQLFAGPVFRTDATAPALDAPVHSDPDQPAFVLLSSGSTGTPKMIVRSHRSFFHRLRWTWEELPYKPGERCVQKSHMTTTHAIYELFEPLLAGVPVTLVGDAQVRDLESFWETIASQGVTRLLIVPSLLRASLDIPGFAAPPLQALTLMGEAVDGALADRAVRTFAATPSIVSIYGSTESSSSLVVDLRAPRPAGDAPSLGVPIDAAIEAFVLDEDLEPVGEGEAGMLYLAGPQLFTAYLNAQVDTTAAFATAPDGRRRYRTEDVVRRRADGSLEFVGRTGDTVKVRGFRVDLREVEAALDAAPGVRHAAAVPIDDRLIAFVAPAGLSPADVLRTSRDRLPAQMVPAAVVAVDDFPRAANGKIDRRRLAADWKASQAVGSGPLEDEDQALVAGVWRDVLGPVSIGASTDFFEAGGTSLTVFGVVHRLRSAFGLTRMELGEQSVYRHPTVASLARHLREVERGVVEAGDAGSGLAVSLKAGSDPSLDPVFFIAAAGGALGSYEKLVARLDSPRPLLGIRDPFLWDARDPRAGFTDWIDHYLAAMRARQPAGPYRIVAYSSAGAFGYELARRLRAEGAEVARLVLVDPIGMDSVSQLRYGHWALRALWLPPAAASIVATAGRLRRLAPIGRDSASPIPAFPPADFERFADDMRHDRRHLLRLSVLLELTSGLPVALSDAELGATSPDRYVSALLERFRDAGSDIEADALDRIVVQYELQVRTQHHYRLRRLDVDTVLISPATPYAGLLAAHLSPYVRRLRTQTKPLGQPSPHIQGLAGSFEPGLRSHYLCMRDDTFAAEVAREVGLLVQA